MNGVTTPGPSAMDTPTALIDTLVSARRSGDFDKAVACYDADATIVVQPGQAVGGGRAIAQFVAASAKVALEFTGRSLVVGDGLALHQASWSLSNPDGTTVIGCSADVLRQQIDGSWRIAIDNPWGAETLQPFDPQ